MIALVIAPPIANVTSAAVSCATPPGGSHTYHAAVLHTKVAVTPATTPPSHAEMSTAGENMIRRRLSPQTGVSRLLMAMASSAKPHPMAKRIGQEREKTREQEDGRSGENS